MANVFIYVCMYLYICISGFCLSPSIDAHLLRIKSVLQAAISNIVLCLSDAVFEHRSYFLSLRQLYYITNIPRTNTEFKEVFVLSNNYLFVVES